MHPTHLLLGLATLVTTAADQDTFANKLNFYLYVQEQGGDLLGTIDIDDNHEVKVGNPKSLFNFAANGTKADIAQGLGTVTLAQSRGTRYLLMDPIGSKNTQLKYYFDHAFPTMVRVRINEPSQPRSMLHGGLFAACAVNEDSDYENLITYASDNLPKLCTPVNIYPVASNYTNYPHTGFKEPVRCYTDKSKLPKD